MFVVEFYHHPSLLSETHDKYSPRFQKKKGEQHKRCGATVVVMSVNLGAPSGCLSSCAHQ